MGTPGGLPGLTIFTNQAASKQYDMACDADALTFRREGVDFARLTSSGQLLVGVTSANANGGVLQLKSGITFPSTDVAASDVNTLDDYEEGTFTPTIIGTSSAGTGTYTYQHGDYVKVGKLVSIRIQIAWTAHTGTGNIEISGLPFTMAGGNDNVGVGGYVHRYNSLAIPIGAATAQFYKANYTTKFGMESVDTAGTPALLAMDTVGGLIINTIYYV